MKKIILSIVAVLILAGVFAGIFVGVRYQPNQVPEETAAAWGDEEEKPIPVTNDWRVALLEVANLTPKDGIKQSVAAHFERFDLNRISGQVSPVAEVTSRFNWPLDLLKAPGNAPASAEHLHIKHLPEQLPFWQLKGTDTIIIPVAVWGKFGLSAGFLAVNKPEKTIAGVRFFHSEDSPGRGQSVLLPEFGERFIGKHLFDEHNRFALQIIQPTGAGQKNNSDNFKVDGITGATMTSSGMQSAFKFWTSKEAYGPLF